MMVKIFHFLEIMNQFNHAQYYILDNKIDYY